VAPCRLRIRGLLLRTDLSKLLLSWRRYPHERYIACNGFPRRKMVRAFSPPRSAIHLRTGAGYVEYNIRVASGFVMCRPWGPKSHTAWKPSFACEVMHILFAGIFESTIVQADASRPREPILSTSDHALTVRRSFNVGLWPILLQKSKIERP